MGSGIAAHLLWKGRAFCLAVPWGLHAPAEAVHKQCKRVLHMPATAGSLLKVQGLDDL